MKPHLCLSKKWPVLMHMHAIALEEPLGHVVIFMQLGTHMAQLRQARGDV